MDFISYHDNRFPPTHLLVQGAYFVGTDILPAAQGITERESKNILEQERSGDSIPHLKGMFKPSWKDVAHSLLKLL